MTAEPNRPRKEEAASKGASPEWTSGADQRDSRAVERWLRLRVMLFCAVLLIAVSVVLDFVLVFVLPLPPEVANHSRWDVLMYSPAVLVALILVVNLELRPVSAALQTLRLGLRLTEAERQRALRIALSFPVVLPTVVMVIGTAANLLSFGLDVLGRTPWLWYAVHTTVVTQCIILASCFPGFVYVRSVLRPVIRRLGKDTRYPERSVGLRGRVALLVTTLTALIAAPVASLLLLQLDAQGGRQREQTMRELSGSLADEAEQMGLHSYRRFVRSTGMGEGVTAFVVDARGGVVPQAAASMVQRAGLPPPRAGRSIVAKTRPHRHLAVSPVKLSGGEHAWAGVMYAPRVPGAGRGPLLLVLLGILLVGAFLALMLGGGLARELRGVAKRLHSLSEGKPPEPLSGDVGSLAEIGRVVDGINDLLATADHLRLRGFVEIEQTEEAARSKTEFLANMSHDLRVPLTAIIGFSEFLIRGINGPLNEPQLGAAQKILGSSLKLKQTIDELLDTAKADAGRLSIRRAWTPPATVVSRTVQAFGAVLGGSLDPGRQVRIEVDAGLPPIYIDAERTADALARLLQALGDEHPEARLSLRASTYEKGIDRGIQLEVSDDSGEDLHPSGPEFFDEVVQTEAGKRLRLGPALASRSIRRQRGQVEAFVDTGIASGFRVRFPLALTGEFPAAGRR